MGSYYIFLKKTVYGKILSKVLPLAVILLVGAVPVGYMENWTFVKSLYWAVTSLTTVGYGDVVPTKRNSSIFSIIYLFFSVPFMTLYFHAATELYLYFSRKYIKYIEWKIRRRRLNSSLDFREPIKYSMESQCILRKKIKN